MVDTPPANAFTPTAGAALKQERFPLTLKQCGECGHLQLVDIVDPEVLFRDYVYVSGTSPSFVEHFRRYAETVWTREGLSDGDLVVDIGSNDGTFLRMFQEHGARVLGIDPAEKIAAQASEHGIPTRCDFFGPALAQSLRGEFGPARVISANNVFAHIDDLRSVVEGVRSLLDDEGVFVFEVSYLLNVYQGTLFDTIYHEHLDYHRVGPLKRFFAGLGMTLVDAERVNTHGGSLRGYAKLGQRPSSQSVSDLEALERDAGLDDVDTFRQFKKNIDRTGAELSALLKGLVDSGFTIAAYGAPAKATTLMHQFALDQSVIQYVIDDSPWKQGLHTPGLGLPVRSADVLKDDPPDYLLVLAWNFATPIIEKNRGFLKNGGRFIVPLPTLNIVDS